jgi:hypothetical protein
MHRSLPLSVLAPRYVDHHEAVAERWLLFISQCIGAVMKRLLMIVVAFLPMNANADWHQGAVQMLSFGYDGQTLAFRIAGVSKTTCTCYSPWPDHLCVSRTRQDFKELYAFFLKARATREPVWVYIDESTCSLLAAYETD